MMVINILLDQVEQELSLNKNQILILLDFFILTSKFE